MAKTAGRNIEVGIAAEAVAGTPISPTYFPKWLSYSMQAVVEKTHFKGARGVRAESDGSIIKRQYSQGQIAIVPDCTAAAYFFSAALGSKNSVAASGETLVYEHSFTVQNANASMKTLTVTTKEGGVQTEQFANCVVNSLNLECSDDFAKLTAELIGMFPSTPANPTPSYTDEVPFSYANMTIKFGANITAAKIASATPIKALTLNINNNVLLDEAFLSGNNGVQAGGLVAGPLSVSGTYTLHFADTTELAKYKVNTKNAAVISLLGTATIGNAEKEEISIELAKLVLTKPPMEYNIDGIVTLTQEFKLEYGATDKDIKVVVTTDDNGANY